MAAQAELCIEPKLNPKVLIKRSLSVTVIEYNISIKLFCVR